MAPLPTLTAANHTQFLASHALVLVLYASPWCPHRQRLLPTLEMAAAAGLPEEVSIALCEEAALAEAAGSFALPSLRLHRRDEQLAEPFELDVPEADEASAIAALLRRQGRATPLRIRAKEELVEELSSSNAFGGVTAVLFADEASEEAASLQAVAAQGSHWRGLAFALAEPGLAAHFVEDEAAPLLLLFRGAAAELSVSAAELPALRDPVQMRLMLAAHAQPLLAQIGAHNYAEYAEAGRPLVWLFLNTSCCHNSNRQAKLAAAAAAHHHRGAASFVWLDGELYSHHAKALGAAARALPALAAEAHGAHYVYDGPLEDAGAVAAWAEAVVEQRLPPTLRSAPPPLTNPGPVMGVVAATFEALVLRAAMPVLLHVHAPWCEQCAASAAMVEALATAWQERLRTLPALLLRLPSSSPPASSSPPRLAPPPRCPTPRPWTAPLTVAG